MSEIKYKGIEFSTSFQEYHPIFWCSFWSSEKFLDTYKRITGTDVGFIYIVRNGEEFVGYMQTDGPEIIYNSLKNVLSKEWMENELSLFGKLLKKIKDLVENKTEDIKELYETLSEAYPYSNAFYLLSQELEKKIVERLSLQFSKQEVNEIMTELSTPIQDTFLTNYTKDIYNISKEIQKVGSVIALQDLYRTDEKIKKQCDDLAKKYFCLTSLNGEIRTAESFISEIFTAQSKQEKSKTIEIPSGFEEDFYLLRSMIYFKDEISTFIIPYVRFGLNDQWEIFAKKLGLTMCELELLTIEETLDNTHNFKKLCEERKTAAFFLHVQFEKTVITEGATAEKQIHDILIQENTVHEDVSEIHGKVGSSGYAKGIVQKILSSKEIPNFKEGNILVTVYTAPEFVPIMKKAIAIVTDTGGITSHAAIVSRELNIPCIVGLKIATKVLKDGDIIEVDANTGIVKIL